ncbi:unnamed protein product [Paramecium primaurelia]|uniref:Uncharacterized protein n=1 Tax=Paramecium primaurelia TaxID=5886 RepID=A0A8S1NDY5_PARPR|nr:unnamed protein product [Paramecium primaurelia]
MNTQENGLQKRIIQASIAIYHFNKNLLTGSITIFQNQIGITNNLFESPLEYDKILSQKKNHQNSLDQLMGQFINSTLFQEEHWHYFTKGFLQLLQEMVLQIYFLILL